MSYSRQVIAAALVAAGRLNYRGVNYRQPVNPVPREHWPAWALKLAEQRQPADRGVGDTAKRELGTIGETLEQTAKRLGLSCGCANAKERWNAKFSYATPDMLETSP